MNFYTGQSGDLSAAGFESSSNSLPPISTNAPTALIGYVCPSIPIHVCVHAFVSVCLAKTCLRPSLSIDHKKHIVDRIVDPLTASVEMAISQPPVKRIKIYPPDRGEFVVCALPCVPCLTIFLSSRSPDLRQAGE